MSSNHNLLGMMRGAGFDINDEDSSVFVVVIDVVDVVDVAELPLLKKNQ